ncbi:hypothetical protein ACFPER_04075 [Agromyces aurantiacus]|uniref:Uncharacterized protein n=1 Tax=Agromyces aurantiacus TaxID=165814 RepID=A0ABV9R2X4_9MICO
MESHLGSTAWALTDFDRRARRGREGDGSMVETSAPAKRPVIVWDLVLTIVLLVLMAGLGFVLFFFSFFLAFASDSCGASSVCDTDLIATGMLVAMTLPIGVGVLALVAAIIVLVLRRVAFWIPIVGVVLMVGAFLLGAAIATAGVQPTG